MFEIIFTERTKKEATLHFEDITGTECKIALETGHCVKINNKTNVLEIDTHLDLPKMTVKDKIYIYIDLMLLGRMYDLSVTNDEEFTYIKCIFK